MGDHRSGGDGCVSKWGQSLPIRRIDESGSGFILNGKQNQGSYNYPNIYGAYIRGGDIYGTNIYPDINSTNISADINISVWGINH